MSSPFLFFFLTLLPSHSFTTGEEILTQLFETKVGNAGCRRWFSKLSTQYLHHSFESWAKTRGGRGSAQDLIAG